MGDLSLSDYAKRSGINVQRARVLASQGRIDARKIGSQWVVTDNGTIRIARRSGRPPSTATVWTVAQALEEGHLRSARDPQRRRAAKRVLEQLAAAMTGSARLHLVGSVAANRGELHHVRAADPVELAADPRVARSGLCWEYSPIQSVDDIDLYIQEAAWSEVQRDHALVDVPRSRANARVRLVSRDIQLARDVPALIAAADLADIGSPRALVAAQSITAGIIFGGMST